MKRIKLFEDFIKEAQIDLTDPGQAGDVFAGVIAGNKDIKEEPKGSNTGRMVNQYLSSVGLKPGLPWCAAFVYYIFDQATKRLHIANPLPKTGGVMNMWDSSDRTAKIDIKNAKANPSLIKPGQIFIMTRKGKGLGHTGIVLSVDVARREFVTVEIDKSKIPLSPLNSSPSDQVVSGYEEELGNLKAKPAGFMARILAGAHSTATGKLAQPDELQAQMDKLR